MFIVAATGRSGSTFFGDLLNSHEQIEIVQEPLYQEPTVSNRVFYRFWAECIQKDISWISPNKRMIVFNQYLARFLKHEDAKLQIGWDLKLEQLAQMAWATDRIHQVVSRIIFLRRSNLLKQIISDMLIRERASRGDKQVHRSTVPEPMTITIDPTELLTRMREKQRIIDDYQLKLRGCSIPQMYVSYEDLMGERRDTILQEALDFLEMPRLPLSSPLVKQNPEEVANIIENYEDVRKCLNSSEFAYTLFLPS